MNQGKTTTSFLGRVLGYRQQFFIHAENMPPEYTGKFGNPENFSAQGGYSQAANELVGWAINSVPFSLRDTDVLGSTPRTTNTCPLTERQLRFLRATYSLALANYFLNLSTASKGEVLHRCSENRNNYQWIGDVPDPFWEFAL